MSAHKRALVEATTGSRGAVDINSTLERYGREELIALAKQMLQRVPELETLLEILPPGSRKSGHKIDAKSLRRQIASAFRVYDYDYEYEYGAEDRVAAELDATLALGDGFLKQGEVENAVTVYETVADELTERFEDFHDESGALGGTVHSALEGLGRCLAKTREAALRGRILGELFEIYRFDVDSGGMGLGDEVPKFILKQTSDAEQKQVAEWVRAAMKKRSGAKWSDNWHRQIYGGFLLKLKAGELDDEAYLRLCRQAHRLKDLVARLLKLNRIEEVVKEVTRADDYELLELADLLVRHKQVEVAERLVVGRARNSQDTRLAEWLVKRLKVRGDLAGVLTWEKRIFEIHPWLPQYQQVQELATQLGVWPEVRAELLGRLRDHGDFDLLTQIHLDAQEIDAALESVERVRGYLTYFYPNLRMKVAAAAEATHPREALRIYLQAARHIIKSRNRPAYAQACKYLLRIRKLYNQLGEHETWKKYLHKLKEETKMLSALKEEMARARL